MVCDSVLGLQASSRCLSPNISTSLQIFALLLVSATCLNPAARAQTSAPQAPNAAAAPLILFSYTVLPGDTDPKKEKLHLSWNVTPATTTTSATLDSKFILPSDYSLHELSGMPLQLKPSCQSSDESCTFSTDLDLTAPPTNLSAQRGLTLSLTVKSDSYTNTITGTIDMASIEDGMLKLEEAAATNSKYQSLTASDSTLKTQYQQLKSTLASAAPAVFWGVTGSFQGSTIYAISTCALTVHAHLQSSNGSYDGSAFNLPPAVRTLIPSPSLPSDATDYEVSLIPESQCAGVKPSIAPSTAQIKTLGEPYIDAIDAINVQNEYLRLTIHARYVAYFRVKLQKLIPGSATDLGPPDIEIPAGSNCQGSLGDCDVAVALPQPSTLVIGNEYRAVVTPETADHHQVAANFKNVDFKGLSSSLASTVNVSFASTGVTISPTLIDQTVPVTMDVTIGAMSQHASYTPTSSEKTLSITINAANLTKTSSPPPQGSVNPSDGAVEGSSSVKPAAKPQAGGNATFVVTLSSNDGTGRVQTVPLTLSVAPPPAGSKAATFVNAAKATDPTAAPSQVKTNPSVQLKDFAQSAFLLFLKMVL